VEVFHGSIVDVAADAYVSPANSFGIMDGGIDVVLARRFPLVEARVQDAIAARGAPLPVGDCVIVETGDFDLPYLVCAPTMHRPSRVAFTEHAHIAMSAILRHAHAHPEISSLAVPGLCTGVGEMPPEVAAEQMLRAYVEWLESS
jgi:O-acetyl-ADP-ribose deacetylase (regulator of RNase III)